MSKSMRFFIPVWCSALLASCDADVLAPSRELGPQALAARPGESTFSAWPVSAGQISLSWTDNSKNETGWEVHRSTGVSGAFSLLASLSVNSTAYDNTGLTPLTEYCYKVRSFKKSGPNTTFAAFTGVVCARTFGPPPAPSGVSAVPRTSTVVDVSWNDNANTELGHRVERSADPDPAGSWQPAATLGSNVTSFADFSRTPDQQVCYRVVATNDYGFSASDADCTSPPQGTTQVSATVNGQSINVSWTDASNVEDGYEVQRALDDGVWSVIGNLPDGATSHTDPAPAPDVRNWYRIRAKKDGGFSNFSGQVWAAVATRAPDAPTIYYASPSGSTAAAIGWSSVGATTTAIRIERSTDGQASWATAGTVDPNNYGFWDGDRTPESQVCYRLFARNSFDESGPSDVDCTIPPAGPTNLNVSTDENGDQTFTWTDNSSVEERYELWYVYCYYVYYDYYDCYWDVLYLDPNTPSAWLPSYAYFDQLYAYYDGGYSDPATWAGVSAMRISATPSVARPIKGAKAPRPIAAGPLRVRPRR
jgi:hypothetical protein